ncbi:hypothetical protein M0813_10142 [Anaeramoeba flamelloides]|uniref:Uncharacterized protein n=1 Tax=Anaeramoeba flamelloides TaxID=1746091 RepID=A0ABQ8X7N9_9EUKA|nr:hypothetical protein M0813_10142 [Anaeramoeba flamelloides]
MTNQRDFNMEIEIHEDKNQKKQEFSSFSDPTPESDKYSSDDSDDEIVAEKPQSQNIVENKRSSEEQRKVVSDNRSSNSESALVNKELTEFGEIEEVTINNSVQERSSHTPTFTEEQIETMLEMRILSYFKNKILREREDQHKKSIMQLFRQFPELMTINNPIEMFASALCVCERQGIKPLNVSFVRVFFGIPRGRIPRAKKSNCVRTGGWA